MPMLMMLIYAYDDDNVDDDGDDDYVDDDDNVYDGLLLITGRILHSVLGRCLLSPHHL